MSNQEPGAVAAWIDLVRAEFRKAVSRRAVKVIGLVAFGLTLLVSWSNYKAFGDELRQVQYAIEAYTNPDHAFEQAKSGRSKLLPFAWAELEKGQWTKYVETQLTFGTSRLRTAKAYLHPEYSFSVFFGVFGTAPGVALAVLFASTLAGAEFRWRYGKMAALFEPRRARLVLAKLVAVWLVIAGALALLLAVSYAGNALFAQIYDFGRPLPVIPAGAPEVATPIVQAAGWPAISQLLPSFGIAVLTTAFYASLAVAAVTLVRASLAGPLGSIGFLMLDGALITPRLLLLRHVSPAQQIAFLLPLSPYLGSEAIRGMWFVEMSRITDFSFPAGADPKISVQELGNIPDWRALLVLGLWFVIVSLVAIAGLRSRDLPP